MRKTNTKIPVTRVQLYTIIFYIVCLLISNLIANRQATFFGLNLPSAVILYPVVFIISDVISEVWGYKWSRKACYIAFIANLFLAIVGVIACALPYPSYFTGAESYSYVLGVVPRILAASLASFIVGDWVNDRVFRLMKRKNKDTSKGYGLRAIVSSIFGQLFDSGIFIPCAFLGTMPISQIITMIFAQVIFKVCYEIIVLPLNTYIMKKIKKAHVTELTEISPKLYAEYEKSFE